MYWLVRVMVRDSKKFQHVYKEKSFLWQRCRRLFKFKMAPPVLVFRGLVFVICCTEFRFSNVLDL